MTTRWHILPLAAALALGVGCGGDDSGGYDWDLPEGFPEPRVPEDNPMSAEKAELGRFLFYDTRLSGNGTQSCGSCHVQSMAFTDGLARAEGSLGDAHPRGSMSLANVAYQSTLTWANPVVRTLEDQAPLPMFGEDPIVELGLAGREDELLERLRADERYQEMFPAAFPDDPEPISVGNVVKAIASFQRTLVSGSSPYDRYIQGDTDAMSEEAVRGMELFFSETVECFHCHGGFNFSANVDHSGQVFEEAAFFNNGLYNVDGRGAYPAGNQGLYDHTADPADQGRFKPPTLRNIEVTAPYMHDGSIATLEEVIDHYAAGGRNVTEGEHVGDGRENPNKSLFVSGFDITEQQKQDLLAFLRALTDPAFLEDPRFSDPFAD